MPHRRFVAALLLSAYLPACTAYHQTEQPLAQLTASPKPVGRLCITKRNGVRVEVREPRVISDSLVGQTSTPGQAEGRVAIALAEIQSSAVRKFDAGKTVAVLVIIGGSIALMSAAMNAMMDDMWGDTSFGY
jgi:hypothetical protein